MTILYLEDDEDDQMIFIEAAKVISNDISCIVCKSPDVALSLLRGDLKFDKVFLDLNLGVGIDGKAFLHLIKNDLQLQALPVIVYSTSGLAKDIDECQVLGAAEFITKPGSFTDICQQLRGMLVS